KGRVHAMTGTLPYKTEMGRRLKLAYVRVTPRRFDLLNEPGEKFPAHVFHFSDLKPTGPLRYSYRLDDGQNATHDGILYKNTLASYCHVHFASRPTLARRFVEACS